MMYNIFLPTEEHLRLMKDEVNWSSLSEKILAYHSMDFIREFDEYIDWTNCHGTHKVKKQAIFEYNRKIEDALNEKYGFTWRRGKHYTWFSIKDSYLYD